MAFLSNLFRRNDDHLREAMRTIAKACPPGMMKINGVDLGAAAASARYPRRSLEQIAHACRGRVVMDGVDLGAVARRALEKT